MTLVDSSESGTQSSGLPPTLRAVFALIVAHPACVDYGVSISFDIPDRYQEHVEQIAISVYLPDLQGGYGCDDLAYDQVTPRPISVLDGVADVDGSWRGSAVDRSATKLVVAIGIGAEQKRVVAGCVEIGVVDGAVERTIKGEPVTLLAMPSSVIGDEGEPPPTEISAAVEDVLGEPVGGASILFRIHGGGLRQAVTGSAVTADDGLAQLELQLDTPHAGPVELEAVSRWSEAGPRRLSAFYAGVDLCVGSECVETTPGFPVDYLVGRIGGAGEVGFLFMTHTVPDAELRLGFLDGEGVDVLPVVLPRGGSWVAGLFGDARVLLIPDSSPHIWHELNIAELAVVPLPGEPELYGSPSAILDLGGCPPAGGELAVMARYAIDSEVFVEDLSRPAVGSAFGDLEGFPVVSGCVKAPEGAWMRALFTRQDDDDVGWSLVVEAAGEVATAELFGPVMTPHFGPADTATPGLPLWTSVNRAGYQYTSGVVHGVVGDPPRVDDLGEDLVVGLPVAAAAGDIDGDDLLDAVVVTQLDADTSALYVVLGVFLGQRRVAAGIELGGLLAEPFVAVRDFDGDGSDDIFVAERRPSGAPAVHLFRMGPLL